jgi:hypothetical protein
LAFAAVGLGRRPARGVRRRRAGLDGDSPTGGAHSAVTDVGAGARSSDANRGRHARVDRRGPGALGLYRQGPGAKLNWRTGLTCAGRVVRAARGFFR